MAASIRMQLLRTATVAAVALTLAGCATRYDAQGNRIYVWQFGQNTDRAVDYSNPRLPKLPAWRPMYELWPLPDQYQQRDMSQYSFLAPQSPLDTAVAGLGDNPLCAASCDSNARPALVVVARADARDGRAAPGAR
jgi:hypothetical protein